MSETKPVKIDVEGSDLMSNILLDLLNRCPALNGNKVAFATLSAASGLAFFPGSGAAIASEKDNIWGDVHQVCNYPFTVVRRVAPKSEVQRLRTKELLDMLGCWLERQPILVDEEKRTLDAYPDLSESGRTIKTIRRTSASNLSAAYDDGVEDWTFAGQINYENDFET